MMQNKYKAIYLSPHLDDAALSCGGQIFQQTQAGDAILIVTIMAGDPPTTTFSGFAQELHDRWELATEMVATRRAEDVQACHILGADHLHWQIPDCIYRIDAQTNKPFYHTWEKIINTIHPQEQNLVQQLAQQFTQLPLAEKVIAPLGVGNHVDHQIVRNAAKHCFGSNLHYFEDYPYAQTAGDLQQTLKDTHAWHSTQIPLSSPDLHAKVEAIAAFNSQLSTFFNGRIDLEQQIKHYSQQVGGERIWQQA